MRVALYYEKDRGSPTWSQEPVLPCSKSDPPSVPRYNPPITLYALEEVTEVMSCLRPFVCQDNQDNWKKVAEEFWRKFSEGWDAWLQTSDRQLLHFDNTHHDPDSGFFLPPPRTVVTAFVALSVCRQDNSKVIDEFWWNLQYVFLKTGWYLFISYKNRTLSQTNI